MNIFKIFKSYLKHTLFTTISLPLFYLHSCMKFHYIKPPCYFLDKELPYKTKIIGTSHGNTLHAVFYQIFPIFSSSLVIYDGSVSEIFAEDYFSGSVCSCSSRTNVLSYLTMSWSLLRFLACRITTSPPFMRSVPGDA